ncbi:MAG TPA: ABC transporter ATP-binding protein [Candidatus Dormibacteraeota bacterium]|jgi:branched-chain amino acid transport system ATP-binding protein|nr:ABC transporter ATP-binding protein [Candidatus Dormibacteraeota bacterium]
MPELSAVDVTAGYDGPPILDRVTVHAEARATTVILGPNGAGKSTLAKAIMGLLTVSSGRVELNGEDVTGMGPHKLVRRGVGYLPQLMNIFDQMSVLENLQMGGYTLRNTMQARIDTVLELFPDLAKDRQKKSGTLSGGQQRMLALARLLMTEPKVAILDEPTAGLSPLYAERVWEQIDRIRELGVGLLVVEQNASMAMDHADSVYLLAQGRNVSSGKAAELRRSDEVARILVG